VDPSAIAGLTRLAEQSCVAGQAEALERLVAGSVLAARHRGALGAGASGVANPAAALARRLAITSGAVASIPATGCRSRVREKPLSLKTIFLIYTYVPCRRVLPSRACRCIRRAWCIRRVGNLEAGCTCRRVRHCIQCGTCIPRVAGSSLCGVKGYRISKDRLYVQALPFMGSQPLRHMGTWQRSPCHPGRHLKSPFSSHT